MFEVSGIFVFIIVVVVIIVAPIIFGLEELSYLILDNEMTIFIVTFLIIGVIAIICILAGSEIVPSLSIAICISSNIFFIINSFAYYIANHDGDFSLVINILMLPVWFFSLLIVLLLSLGIPAIIIAIYYFFGIDANNIALRIFLGFLPVAASVACFVILVLPALRGDFSIYFL